MKNLNKKTLLLLISVAVLLLGTVGVTMAYLTTKTDPIENTFTPAEVGVEVTDHFETVDGKKVKKDVTITNTEDVDVYVRVAVVANWVDAEGNCVPHWIDDGNGGLKAWNVLDELSVDTEVWTKNGNYYYSKNPVKVGNDVELLDSYTPSVGPATADHLEMQIIAQAIQAEPTTAASEAWGYVPTSSGN